MSETALRSSERPPLGAAEAVLKGSSRRPKGSRGCAITVGPPVSAARGRGLASRAMGLLRRLTEMGGAQDAWRKVVRAAVDLGFPTPAFSASMAYYDSYRRERLPANLIQAQRDFFGAHTYERTDKPGAIHTEWSQH